MESNKYKDIISFIRQLYNEPEEFIPLHVPVFRGNEKKYLNDCIDSTFVSSVGKYVDKFEQMIAEYTGAKYAVAAVNGTAALHIALKLSEVERDSLVITQPLTFIATINAIRYCGASPVFVDVDRDTLGMSPDLLKDYLENNTYQKSGISFDKVSKQPVKACVPMHTFGHSCRIDEIAEICKEYNIALVEDAAESLGSYYKGKHTGTFGEFGTFSFNGNKTITTGGGGMIVTDNEDIAKRAKHITTTAKVPHAWEYIHDEVGYNYRLTNLAAAIGCAQMEQLPDIINTKREIAEKYKQYFGEKGIQFILEPDNSTSNYWLNALVFENRKERDEFLEFSNKNGVMSRPVWELMNRLSMFKNCPKTDLSNSEWLADRIVNIPSSCL